MIQAPQRFYLLDALRGVAALAVVVWHYQHFFFIGPGQLSPDFVREAQPFYLLLQPFYQHGAKAVQLFFVLSGFVFFSQYLDKISAGQVGAWRFFVLRFSRLYPLHFVTLLAVAGLQLISLRIDGQSIVYPCNDSYHFILQLLFVSGWGFEQCWSFNEPAWSVSVEVLLYFLFFVFALTVPRSLRPRLGLALAAGAIGALVKLTVPGPVGNVGLGILCFYLGGAVFLTLDWLVRRGFQPATIATAAGFITLGGFVGASRSVALLYSVAFPALVLTLAALQYCRFDIGRSLRVLGDISYSTYLTHFPIQLALLVIAKIGLISIDYQTRTGFLLFFALLLIISMVSYYAFEKPTQEYLRSVRKPLQLRV